MNFIQPVTLEGEHATLELLAPSHCSELIAAVRDGELWKLWYTRIPHPEQMAEEIERRRNLHSQGSMLPFAIRRHDTGRLCGMTTYMAVDVPSRRLEIGSTWYAKSAQKKAINTECKLMLLTHAFENLHCIAVEFRTSFMNHPSREAILRLGAKQDGILRNHTIMPDGTYRDTVVFSIIESEWPTVRRHLQYKLGR